MPKHFSRYAMYGLIYFAEGAILSFFTSLNAVYLLSFNLSMGQVGLIGMIAMLPFVLKIFMGMLSDQVNLFGFGYRRPYIVIGLVLQALVLTIIPLINPGTQFGLFVLAAFVLMAGQALYDTTTDGLALDTTEKAEQGTIQGIMVGGRALGVVMISGILGLVVQQFSWSSAFYLLAVLTLIPLPLVLFLRFPARANDQKFEWGAFSAFKRPAIINLGLLGALYSLVTYSANQVLNPYLQQLFGFETLQLGMVTTVWGVGVVIGGLSGGKLVDRVGKRNAVRWAIYISSAAIILLVFMVVNWLAWPLALIFGVAFGYYETVYFALSMQETDPRIAASMYSILMAIANLGTAVGLGASGSLVDAVGFRLTLVIMAAINLFGLFFIPVIFKPKAGEKNEIRNEIAGQSYDPGV
jgi:PAT family beta-lactamase induction signal transducer AmpG